MNLEAFQNQLAQGLSDVSVRVLATLDAGVSVAARPEAARMTEACDYPVAAGGKRVRPMLLTAMAGAVGGDRAASAALPAAIAIELIHTYSLVHDDLPCMDNDDFRRGRPTTHKVYGEAQGLLVGDSLLTEAFTVLTEIENPVAVRALCRILASRAGASGMIFGQWLDLAFTGKAADWETLETIHRLKTGRLLSAALEMGAVCGHAEFATQSPAWLSQVAEVGMNLGLAFQILDDILDVTRTSAELGKTAGKDQSQLKFTAVSLLGLEEAKRRAKELTRLAEEGLAAALKAVPENASVSPAEKARWSQELRAMFQSLLERSR